MKLEEMEELKSGDLIILNEIRINPRIVMFLYFRRNLVYKGYTDIVYYDPFLLKIDYHFPSMIEKIDK